MHGTPKRFYRLALYGLGAMLLLSIAGLFLATRSFVLKAIAEPHVEATFGGDIEIGSIRWLGLDELEINQLVVRAPGWSGEAAEVVFIQTARITLDRGALRTGSFEILEMDVEGMNFRIAERAGRPGEFNVLALQPADAEGEGTPPRRINVRDFILEMGVVDADGWRPTGTLGLSGDLVANPEVRQQFLFSFLTSDVDLQKPSVLKGAIDTSSLQFTASMDEVRITDRLLGMMPLELRQATETLDLEGVIERFEISWDTKQELYASLDIGSGRMIIPSIDREETWSVLDAGIVAPAERNPLMEIDSGRLRIEEERFFVDGFQGRLVGNLDKSDPIPIRVDFEMDLSEPLEGEVDWSDADDLARHLVDVAPFVLDIGIPNFRIRSDGEGVVLPTAAARALSEFGVEEWRVNIKSRIDRAPPSLGPDGTMVPGTIQTRGEVSVDNGSGRYSRFPYPLENVRASIQFVDDLVTIDHLVGTGPEGGSVIVEGTIVDPGPAAAIEVKITGRDVPADRTFRSALDGWRRRVWDRFFDQHAERKLRQAGLLTTSQDIEEAVRRRTEILRLLADREDADQLVGPEESRLAAEAERLDRIIRAGPFSLGGIFSFDLRVSSPAGENQPVFLTGDIDILEGNVVVSDFPFPIHLEESKLVLTPDDILMQGGLFFTTPQGGTGVIRGSIHNPATPEDADPISVIDVSFAALQVEVTETLLAALPPSKGDQPIDPNNWPGGWRSEPATALAAIGLQGRIDLEGTLKGDRARPEEEPDLRFETRLNGGSIRPDSEMSDFFARAGFIWPEGFQLDSCDAVVTVEPEYATLERFTGRRRGGTVEASGFVSRQSEASGLEVAFKDIQIEEYLIDFVPDGPRSRVVELWQRFQPKGMFDADLSWNQTPEGLRDSVVQVEPAELALNLNGDLVRVERRQGEIFVRPNDITLEELLLEVSEDDQRQGLVSLNGSYGVPREGRLLALDGAVEDGQFESAVLEVLLELIGVPRVLSTWRELDPSGRFESHFEYRGVPVTEGGTPEYRVDVAPSSLSLTLEGQRIHAAFEGGALHMTPGRFDLEHLLAAIPAPGMIDINGNVTVQETIDAELLLSYDLAQLPEGFQLYLPPPLSTALEPLEFATDGPVVMRDARLSGSWADDAPIDRPDRYEFSGSVEVTDGRFEAGPSFDEMDAVIELECSAGWDPEQERLVKRLRGSITGERLDVQDRGLRSFRADMRLGEDDVFHLEEAFGMVAGGAVASNLRLDLQDLSWDLRVDLEDGALEVLSRGHDEQVSEGTEGMVLGALRLSGTAGDPQSKSGTGLILIEEGKMTNSPLTLQIIQLSQLMLPVSSNLESAEISFTIEGNRMVFDEFYLTSAGLRLDGTGEMSLKDWELALRLFPRGTIPLFSDLIGTVTGTLYAVNVEGTIDDPRASLEALPLLGDSARIDDEIP